MISVQKHGILSLNRSAYARLGQPDAVQLLYDRDRQLIGLQAADTDEPHAQRVRRSSNKSAYVVSAARFTSHYKIATDTARRWQAEQEGDVLFIDLTKPPEA